MKKTDREHVLNITMEVMEEGKQCKTVLHQVFHSFDIGEKERSFIKRLTYGVIERAIELDALINRFSKIKTKKMKPVVRGILRMGVYELKYMDHIPASATCNEAVNLVGKRGFKGLKGFVNGVLRTIAREMNQVDLKDVSFSEKYSMPDWIVSLLQEQYETEQVIKILQSFLEEKPVTIRVNREKITVQNCHHAMTSAGYDVKPGVYFAETMLLQDSGNVEMLPGFLEGYFVVQDESSMLPAKCAGIKEGQYILDLCAAPGGKTLQAAEYTGRTGIVYARDITEYKCGKIRENVKRLGFDHVNIQCQDARDLEEELVGKMDIVIADVPCSGIGIIGRKPDIKYHITRQSVSDLITLQRQILDTAVSYVKPGGVLIYSTCTINKEENEDNVCYIEDCFPFHRESLASYLPEALKGFEIETGMIQILPGIAASDGFFAARLVRKE